MLHLRNGIQDLTHPPARNIANLDILRSLAILLVFSGHFGGEFHASPAFLKLPPIYFGWTGVDLFFVLSGYLIGAQIWKEIQKTGTVELGRFLLRRGLRIWPLYFSFVLLIAAEGILFHRNCSGLWADATFLSDYFHHQVGGGWSLSTEEQFYIFFPLVILALAKIFPFRRAGWLLPVAALALLPLFRELTLRHYAALPLAQVRDMMYYPIHTHADGLAAGVLIAWVQTFHPNILGSTTRNVILGLSSMCFGVALYVVNRDVFSFSSLAFIFGGMAILAIGIAVPWPRFIVLTFYLISRLSYGIYLNHFGLLPWLMKALARWQGGSAPIFLFSYLLSFTACLAFAFLTFLLIEHPFLVLRERWLKRAVTRQTPAVAL